MTTAAQNMHGLLRKLPLRRNHFFEWLKTAVLLIDCGTSTLKSLPSRVFAAPHVHPRLRKRLSRCTLDCGFKTSESPALRGFVAERCPIRGTSLYLVLKSNGLRHSKNLPVKFVFSLKTVPANIAKKLPPQRCFKPLFIPVFNFSYKWPTFAFTGESGYTLGFRRRIAHSGLHGETGGVSDGGGITTLGAFRTFTSIPGPGIRTASFAAFGAWSGVLPKNAGSLGTAMRSCASLFRGVAAPLGCVICLQLGDVAVFSLCAQYFFPGSLSTIPCAVTFSANTQISLSAISVANTFALWYDKSQIRIFRR